MAPGNRSILEAALHSKLPDFEDAVVHESAVQAGVDGIVTRDLRGFRGAAVPFYSPEELVQIVRLRRKGSD